ncbi:hypothetical protein [Bradyrhizobium yuanmingense]|uniref:hypothetical protein n=1 Tax=Bradyrhizobium yuanmingense TaxID=108015 RepID=UPI0004B0B291|nr:hypothetical protein [Bradyrhizobium yuanmingense]
MSDLKKHQPVKAKTVRGDKYQPGKITDVRQGAKGAWYSVKLDDGTTINTRAACIKPL